MDRFASMATFVKVVDTGSFAAAGRKLGLSPSTVTTQIKVLEKRVGALLLNRNTRRSSLTEIGKAYYERCARIVADAEDADNVVHSYAVPHGTSRINVSLSIPVLLAPVIAEFTSIYPEVDLSVTMTDRIVDLVEERIDLAISTLPISDSTLVMRRIGSFKLLVCGSPIHFWQTRRASRSLRPR